ncbi:Transthyretin-like family protein [Dictyocaulus viviparus]|uniref:Transthyretin-like family protein n=1 Tax=Dictyocaulus viviparus TaxID=29172 RepID=A0A0D8XWQ4_DICVI|nr:Transthyretin-like family protein [Dictyocaulus viviparus]
MFQIKQYYYLAGVAVFSWLDPDDLLDKSYSDSKGEFHLIGGTTEFTAMEPVLSVYHDCNDGIKSGVRKLSFGLPDHYITPGPTPRKTMDVGVINLELHYKAEERVDNDPIEWNLTARKQIKSEYDEMV